MDSPSTSRSSIVIPTLISYLLASLDKTLSFARSSPNPHLAALLTRLNPILRSLPSSDLPSLHTLDAELGRARDLLRSGSPYPLHGVGRCLALLLSEAPADSREAIASLHNDMLASAPGGRGEIALDLEDLFLQVKKGDEAELGVALAELRPLVENRPPQEAGELVPALLNRLCCADKTNRLQLVLLLRTLASLGNGYKERMESMEALSSIVRLLARDANESREAVGLLLDLSSVPKVRQRIGRVQGCMVMLAALLKGDDTAAACDARRLLQAISSITQNVLLMAEAGYFVPLVRYLDEGSDMNKILMATAISRMELTNQMKASLGEEGSIEPLVKMFTSGKLEAKLSALGALRNLSSLTENIPRLISARVVAPLLQLLFSVTSVLMTLREPAAAILASVAQSDLILKYKHLDQRILSLLNLCSPTIQLHLLMALNSIVGHSNSTRIKANLKENGAMQLLLPFLTDSDSEMRTIVLNLLFNLSKDFTDELTEQMGDNHLNILVHIIATSTFEREKAAAVGIVSNIPVKDKIATGVLVRANLLPVLISLLEVSIKASSTPERSSLLEGIAGVMVRFTVPWDKKLQTLSVALGLIPCLVNLLSDGTTVTKARAATSLAQLSQNSPSLSKVNKSPRWFCVHPSSQTSCEVHTGCCTVKNTFCLVKAGAISPLLRILEGKEREADEAVLDALSTLMQDEILESGTNAIEKASGVQAIIRVLEVGSLKAQEKAVWMLERVFRIENHTQQYGEAAGVVLIDLAQRSDQSLKSMIAKILAQLQLLQMQSTYF